MKYKAGDIIKVCDNDTKSVIDAVVTKVAIKEGNVCYFVRRKDNHAFAVETGYKYNIWVLGEKVEVKKDE